MATFRFDAKDRSGANISGEVQADSPREAARQLQAQGLFVMRLKEDLPSYAQPRGTGLWRRFFAPVLWPASPKASASYFHSFASLLASGVSTREAALTLAERAPAGVFKAASREMAEAALRGDSIVSVTPRYPAGFPPFVVAMLAAGDRAGKLDLAMRRLNQYFERAAELASKYRWATLYPKILMVGFLFSSAFYAFGTRLTARGFQALQENRDPTPRFDPREIVVALAWGVIPTILAVIVIWYGWRALMRWQPARAAADRVKLSIPGFGGVVRKTATSKFCSALSMLYGAGVPLHEALVVAGEASGNAALAATTRGSASRVMEGDTVSSVMEASGDFPDLAIDMMTVGERSGRVEESLDKVAEYLAAESTEAGGKTAVAVGILAYLIIAGLIIALFATAVAGYFGNMFKLLDMP